MADEASPRVTPWPLPCGSDGWIAPAGAVVTACPPGTAAVALEVPPPPNATSLPDLLAALGVARIALPGPATGTWRGPLGGTVERIAAPATTPARVEAMRADPVAAARAQALRMWEPLPPAEHGEQPLGAANPCLQARTQVVQLPWRGPLPPALIDDAGARHPAQPWEDGLLCALPLPGLGATRLAAHGDAVPGCAWEVGPQVLDNGRVRAELDADGHLVRLCVGSTFAAWTQPALQVRAGSRTLGPGRVAVTSAGPVRAQLTITRPEVVLTLTLDAHAEVLQIEAASSAPACTLLLPVDCPLPPVAWDGLGRRAPWTTGTVAARACAWIDGQDTGVVLGAGSGQQLESSDDGALLAIGGGTRVGLGVVRGHARHARWWDPMGLITPHLAIGGRERPPAPPLRAALPPGVIASWCTWDASGGTAVLQDLAGGRTRFPLVRPARGALAVGQVGAPAVAIEDHGEGCVVTMPAHGLLVARWRT